MIILLRLLNFDKAEKTQIQKKKTSSSFSLLPPRSDFQNPREKKPACIDVGCVVPTLFYAAEGVSYKYPKVYFHTSKHDFNMISE